MSLWEEYPNRAHPATDEITDSMLMYTRRNEIIDPKKWVKPFKEVNGHTNSTWTWAKCDFGRRKWRVIGFMRLWIESWHIEDISWPKIWCPCSMFISDKRKLAVTSLLVEWTPVCERLCMTLKMPRRWRVGVVKATKLVCHTSKRQTEHC